MVDMQTLVIDDDSQLLEIMHRRLRKMGLEPDRASDGQAALTLIERSKYDVIVTDIYMPGATGLALLRRAKERDPYVQVIIVTGEASLETAVEATNEGAFGYLVKPFEHISVFDNTIKRALEYRRLIMDKQQIAEVQRRRGNLLEDEITNRVGQLQKRQRDLIDLLGSLPDGVLVIGEDRRVLLSSPMAEKWLEQESTSRGKPIQRFIETLNGGWTKETAEISMDSQMLRLTAVNLPSREGAVRKVVIIREIEGEQGDLFGPLRGPLTNLRKGMEWLLGHPKLADETGLVEYVSQQVSEMERLTGVDEEQEGEIAEDSSEALEDWPFYGVTPLEDMARSEESPLEPVLLPNGGNQQESSSIADGRDPNALLETVPLIESSEEENNKEHINRMQALENLIARLERDIARDIANQAGI